MSRSRKKTPISGVTTSNSEKDDKRQANRRYRRISKVLMQVRGDEALIDRRAISNVWLFAKDGKVRIDPRRNPDLMRK